MEYKLNFQDVIKRLKLLYEQRVQDKIFAVMDIPNVTLNNFKKIHKNGYCDCPDSYDRVEFWDNLLKEKVNVEDDSIPSAYFSEFDQGLYGGLLGGNVQFMCNSDTGWISSMVPPLLNSWSEFDKLSLDFTDNKWYKYYINELEIFIEAAKGEFGISHFCLVDSLNFVFELFGATQTYIEMLENPDKVRRAIEFAFKLNTKIHDIFFEKVGLFEGGTCSNFAQWIPGRIVSESVDPFHMTNVDYFNEWGREPVERILNYYDGGCIHIHGNGRHLLSEVSSLKGLKAILLGDDRGYPLAFDIKKDLKKQVGEIPLIITTSYNKFVEAFNKHELIGGVLYGVNDVPDADIANKYMEKVRCYRV